MTAYLFALSQGEIILYGGPYVCGLLGELDTRLAKGFITINLIVVLGKNHNSYQLKL